MSENSDYIIIGDLQNLLKAPFYSDTKNINNNNKINKSVEMSESDNDYNSNNNNNNKNKGLPTNKASPKNSYYSSDCITIGDISSSNNNNNHHYNYKRSNSTNSSINNINFDIPMSVVIIDNIDSVCQILKMSLRDLPEPLISPDCYYQMFELTKSLFNNVIIIIFLLLLL